MTGKSAGESSADVVGVGFGPANIALAIAIEERNAFVSSLFLERRATQGWQDEMLLPGADIQHHPIRDLVTPINPRSRYTFVNYLFESGRLFEHFNLPMGLPLRSEYRHYINWVAAKFQRQVRYGAHAISIEPLYRGHRIVGYRTVQEDGSIVNAKVLVVAPGRSPRVPAAFEGVKDGRVVHLTQFLSALTEVLARCPNPRVAVVGGSQSAVELMLHLATRVPTEKLVCVTRSFGFRQKDGSSFSREVYFPRFIETYYHADPALKAKLRSELHFTNYSAADKDVLDQLYSMIYHDKLEGRTGREVRTLTEVVDVNCRPSGVTLGLVNAVKGGRAEEEFDFVVLATGFKDIGPQVGNEMLPPILASLRDEIVVGEEGLEVDFDYCIRMRDPRAGHAPIYLNGLCETSHGMGDSGAFSLVALRAVEILTSIERRLGELQSSALFSQVTG